MGCMGIGREGISRGPVSIESVLWPASIESTSPVLDTSDLLTSVCED